MTNPNTRSPQFTNHNNQIKQDAQKTENKAFPVILMSFPSWERATEREEKVVVPWRSSADFPGEIFFGAV